MFTADQIIAHAVGDYLTQSHWMAVNKSKRGKAAMLHATAYALPFLVLRPSKRALAVIIGTHYLIDRYKLARYVVWAKNQPAPMEDRSLTMTGYPDGTPEWLAGSLLIVTDNIMHILINGIALKIK